MASRTRLARARQRMLGALGVVAFTCLFLLSRSARAEEDPAELGRVLDGLPAPHAAAGFVYKGVNTIAQGERTVSVPLDLYAYPTREAGSAAWAARMETLGKPIEMRDTVWLTRRLEPIRGEVRSKRGEQEQTFTWQRAASEIRYEAKAPGGRSQKGAVKATKRILVNGSGMVLFLRQLRPRTGSFQFELLVPELLMQAGLIPITLVVSKRAHAGAEAYVGEASLAGGAFRTVVALDPETGALRSLETHIVPRKQTVRFGQIKDKGIAEVHNQTSLARERQGDVAGALAEVEAASAADPSDSVYPLRIGRLHQMLAGAAPEGAERTQHTMRAAFAFVRGADLIAKGLESGRLAKAGAAGFSAMRRGLYESAGQDFILVLGSDVKAQSFFGTKRSALELAAATAFVESATLTTKDRPKAFRRAAGVAGGFATQRMGKGKAGETVVEQLAALAATAYGELVRTSSEDADLWYALGLMQYLADQNEPAIAALERSLSLRPKSPNARVYLGATLARAGRRAEASQQLEILERVGAKVSAETLRTLIMLHDKFGK